MGVRLDAYESMASPAKAKPERPFCVARSLLLNCSIVITQILGKRIQTVQSRQAKIPRVASDRCERHMTAEQRIVRRPLTTPASKVTRVLVCVASLPGNIKSRSQQIALKAAK